MDSRTTPIDPSNTLGLDYAAEAKKLPMRRYMIDAHLHINGVEAARLLQGAASIFQVTTFYSQTRLADATAIRGVLGDAVRFVAGPNWSQPDRARAFREGYLEDIVTWREAHGARMMKLWAAPRLWDFLGPEARDAVPLDSEWRIRAVELAQSLGMMILVHVADPDTWFATKYADASRYGTKDDHYLPLERMLGRYAGPWVGAHMGGSPENLDRLDGLLSRHDNLYLDTSAAKWMVRELSKHEPARLREFFTRWTGRIMFGTDIVTTDDHVRPPPGGTTHPMGHLASSPAAALSLYESRYWVLRALFETDYDGPSPIADPDLMMVEPTTYDEHSTPRLRGAALPEHVLGSLYFNAADALLNRWYARE